MGIIHYAYAFNRPAFGSAMASCIASNGKIELSSLRERALQASRNCSEIGKCLLEDLQFDAEEWLDIGGDADRVEQLVKTCVVESVFGVHRLSRSSFALLEILLPMAGWPQEKVKLMLIGEGFIRLIESVGIRVLVAHIHQVAKSPSWLPLADRLPLATDLSLIADRFATPSDDWLKIAEKAKSRLLSENESPLKLIRRAFSEMEQRLNFGIKNHSDLILINDISSYVPAVV